VQRGRPTQLIWQLQLEEQFDFILALCFSSLFSFFFKGRKGSRYREEKDR
jgi:hypothetical protein